MQHGLRFLFGVGAQNFAYDLVMARFVSSCVAAWDMVLRVLPFFMNRHDAALAHVSNGAKWRIVVRIWNVNRRMLLGKDQATSQQV